jgi:uncharacterized membrane protein YbhN (UPF0104 family)
MLPSPEQPIGGTRKLHVIAIAVIVCGFAALLLSDRFAGLSSQYLFAALAVQPINAASIALIALRTRIVSNGSVSWWPAVKATALTSTLLYVLPSRLSELIKPIYLAETCGIPLVRGMAIITVERFLDVVVVMAALLFSAFILSNSELHWTLVVLVGITAVGFAGCLLLYFRPDAIKRLLSFVPWPQVRVMAERLMTEVRTSIAPQPLSWAMLVSVLAWIASFLMVQMLFATAGSIPLTLASTLVVFLAGSLGLAVAVAPGGLGTFEAGIAMSLKLFGYETGEAISLALVLRVANLGFLPLLAAWAVARDGIGFAALIERGLKATRGKDLG